MRLLALLLAALLVGCGSTGVPITSYHTLFMVEVHPGDGTATSTAGLADIAANLHAGGIRVDYDPPSTLNGQNGYDYSWVRTALADGLRMYFITPYVSPSDVPPNGTAFSAAYLATYAQIAAAGAAAYPGSYWDIVNEPDNDAALGQGQLTEAQYIQLVRAVAPAIKAADSSAAIVGDASASGRAWLLGLAPAYPLLDELAIHPYGIPANQMWSYISALSNATGKQVIVGEWGEAPPNAADLTTFVKGLAGNVPVANVYEYETQPGESPSYGLVGTPGYAAYAAAIHG